MQIDASKITKEEAQFLFKFLKRDENLEKDHPFFKTSQSFFIAFKDFLRPLQNFSEQVQYDQFKRVFNQYFYWSYQFQADLEQFLDWFLEVYSDTNKEDFYKKFEEFSLELLKRYETEYPDKKRARYSAADFCRIYRVNFDKFIDDICLSNDEDFEEEDKKQYETSKKELAIELESLLHMEHDLRKIYNNVQYSLKNKKTYEKSGSIHN